jgi:hypothetical protein
VRLLIFLIGQELLAPFLFDHKYFGRRRAMAFSETEIPRSRQQGGEGGLTMTRGGNGLATPQPDHVHPLPIRWVAAMMAV